jgi:hypothetical protein
VKKKLKKIVISTICSRIYTTPNHNFQYIQGQKLTGAQSPMALRFWSGLQCVSMTSITKGEVPTDWGQANVIPIFKKGETYLASNYRPASLTCICCKLLEHIVVSNIFKHLDLHNIWIKVF